MNLMPHSFFIILLLFFPVLVMLVDTFLGILSYCFYYIFPFFSQFPSIPSNFQLTFIFFFYIKCLIRGTSGKIYKKPLFYAPYFFPEILYQNTLLGKRQIVLAYIKILYLITLNYGRIKANLKKYFVFCHNLATIILYNRTISIFKRILALLNIVNMKTANN